MSKERVYIYKDTVTLNYEGDDNLLTIVLPTEFVKQYASNNKEYNTFEEWKENYTCDETENLFNEVILNNIEYTLE